MGAGARRRGRAAPPPPPPADFDPATGLSAYAPAPAPAAPGARLPRRERLRGRERIDALFAGGRIGQARLVMARALPSPYPLVRVAFLVGKAVGKATARGRLRRRLRALYRERKAVFPLPVPMGPAGSAGEGGGAAAGFVHRGWDVAVLPRRGAVEADAARLGEDLEKAIRRATAAGDEPC